MKKRLLLVFLIIILPITAWFVFLKVGWAEDTTQIAKDEFSKYYNGKDEVVLILNDYIYFENYELNLSALVENNEHNNGLILKQDKIIFSTSENDSMSNFTLNIYESNLLATEIELLYSKNGYKTHPWAYAIDDVFYVEHYSKNSLDLKSKLIDKYTISTGIYENIASGKDCNLSDYMQKEEQSRYSIEIIENNLPQEHEKFIIIDTETGITKTIDDDFLKNTIFIESMEMFNYGPMRFDVSNGHILLTYGIGAGNGWTYPHLVFEYDFELHQLEYKLLAFPSEVMLTEIIYIG